MPQRTNYVLVLRVALAFALLCPVAWAPSAERSGQAIYAEMSLSAGAKGYVMKTEPLVDILLAIRRVLAGGIYLSEPVASRLLHQHARGGGVQASPIERLSDRERQVLSLLGQWQGTREIARQLHLSVKTVDAHKVNLMRKLDLHDRSELIRYAIRKRLVEA